MCLRQQAFPHTNCPLFKSGIITEVDQLPRRRLKINIMNNANTRCPGTDRTWPLPLRSYAMRMRWHDLLFAHWSFPKEDIAALLPQGLEVDAFDGKAWVAVVPFRMTDVAPRFVPAVPWLSAFPELNIRTYVSIDGKPGVWFFSLDATNPIAVRVARLAFHLPYMDAKMSIEQDADWYNYRSHRTHRGEPSANLVARYRPVGEVFYAQPGSLEYWLTARYCLYAQNRSGRLLRGEIDHSPWPLQAAEFEPDSNTMLASIGLESHDEPHLLFAKDIKVKGWLNERL